MKIALVYLNVIGKATPDAPDSEFYHPLELRFMETYRRFFPTIRHELYVVNCGIGVSILPPYFGNATIKNEGAGWDCGTYQKIARWLDCDMAVFMATPVYFWREGWLERLALAWALYGPGLYGPMASYENTPHLRTSCIACSPALLSLWPKKVNTHLDCSEFEQAFSVLVETHGGTCKLVTWDGFYSISKWRKPDNIFRRGDQSNCILWTALRHLP